MTTTPKRLELAVLIALLLLAGFVIWQSARMPSGTLAMPGPGMLPMGLGLLLAISSLGLILRHFRSDPSPDDPILLGNRQILVSMAVMLGAGLLLERVGFVVTGTLFLFALLSMLSRLGWWRSLVAAGVTSVAMNYVFNDLLSVVLPPFPWAS